MAMLKGTSGNDRLVTTSAAADSLYGFDGDDTLDGGFGNDLMVGGRGSDTYILNSASDRVAELADEGIDTIQVSFSVDLRQAAWAHIENVRLAGLALRAQGSDAANVLEGNGWANTLEGWGGDDTLFGLAGSDTLDGGDGNDNLQGGSGRDVLRGGAGDDLLDGGTDGDAMMGGSGNDTYVVDAATDAVTEAAGGGVDRVVYRVEGHADLSRFAQIENMTLAGSGNWNLKGTDGANDLRSSALGTNRIDGLGGNDTLWATAATGASTGQTAPADTLAGGLGDDTYRIQAGAIVKLEEQAAQGHDLVIIEGGAWGLSSNIEDLSMAEGWSGWMLGNELDNVLRGASGADSLDGRGGSDTLIGGLGDDQYTTDSMSDLIVEAIAGGHDGVIWEGASDVDLRSWQNVEDVTLGGAVSTGRTARGNDADNVVTGDRMANVLYGFAGNDTLAATANLGGVEFNPFANDTMYGGQGDDTYLVNTGIEIANVVELADEGVDTIYAGSYQSVITDLICLPDNVENLVVQSRQAGYGVVGNASDNELRYSNGRLTGGGVLMDGGAGADNMYVNGRGIGATFIVDNLGDRVKIDGADVRGYVQSSVSFDLHNTGVTYLALTGDAAISGAGSDANDTVIGNLAANTLQAAAGDDLLQGNGGNDLLQGGDGNDTYRYTRGDGDDRVSDAQGSADVLAFQGDINQQSLYFSQAGGDLLVQVVGQANGALSVDGSVQVQGWFTDAAAHIEQITVAGASLSHTQVDALIAAMAGMGGGALGTGMPLTALQAQQQLAVGVWMTAASV